MNRFACTFLCAAGALLLAGPFAVTGQPAAPGAPAPAVSNRIVKAGLLDWLFGGSTREQPRPRYPRDEGQGDPRRDAVPPREDDDEHGEEERPSSRQGRTFRTLCVRLCDGFYFPISFATTRDRFVHDAAQCEKSCPARSRLFFYRNPGEAIENMVDLDGHRYRDLPTAFRYVTHYVANCTCNGNPWDPEAIARHKAYAQSPPPKPPDQTAGQAAGAQSRAARQSRSMRAYRRPREQEAED
jgi:hypothetical protein